MEIDDPMQLEAVDGSAMYRSTTSDPRARWRRRPSNSPPAARAELLVAIESILAESEQTGCMELVLRSPSGVGSIHACRGAVAWVVAGVGQERLSEVLMRRTNVGIDALRQTYQRCRTDGANFAEALVDDGIVDRDTVRAALLEHNARQLELLLDVAPETLSVVHKRRDYASDLVFSLDELVAAIRPADPSDVPMPPRLPSASASTHSPTTDRKYDMANIKQSLDEVQKIDGCIAAAIVDWESGLTLGTIGAGGGFDIELAASGNTSVVKAKMAVMKQLGIGGVIEDILITLEGQYHLIRPLAKVPSLFLYLAIDKQRGNLGLARHKLRQVEEALVL